MAPNSMDQKVAEAVRRFPILYNKSLKDFKDRNKKKNAWAEVARQAGLSTGIYSELIQCGSIVAIIFVDVF